MGLLFYVLIFLLDNTTVSSDWMSKALAKVLKTTHANAIFRA
jgi:hypothetical protein